LFEPCANYTNSPYSVEMINNKVIPWLSFYDWIDHELIFNKEKSIWAGENMKSFCKKVKDLGGQIYKPCFT
jgi:hypothetical protein